MSVILSALIVGTAPLPATMEACSLVEVIDGDTIRCDDEVMELYGTEAPMFEDDPTCLYARMPEWCDNNLAERSREKLSAFLARGIPEVYPMGIDRFGVPQVRILVGFVDAGKYLVRNGLGRDIR